jgi:hypothetical protein
MIKLFSLMYDYYLFTFHNQMINCFRWLFAFCFAFQSCPREILGMCWDGFLKLIAKVCTIQLLLIESYYSLVINLSVSICYLEPYINQTTKHS